MCRYYYEQGELNIYYAHVEQYALESYGMFDYCVSKLIDEAQLMLDKDESEFRGYWRDFIRFDRQKIKKEKGMPSPNMPTKKKIMWKKYLPFLTKLKKT